MVYLCWSAACAHDSEVSSSAVSINGVKVSLLSACTTPCQRSISLAMPSAAD